MTIDNLTASQREQLKVTVLEDVLGREPSYGEIARADDIVSDEYIEEEFAGVNFVRRTSGTKSPYYRTHKILRKSWIRRNISTY